MQVWETANIDTLKKIHTTYLIGKQQDVLVAAEGALKLMERILVLILRNFCMGLPAHWTVT